MMEPDGDKIRAVAWLELFPWLRIARAFRLAVSARGLVFGAVGILLTVLGWALIGGVLKTDAQATKWLNNYVVDPWFLVTDAFVPDWPGEIVDVDPESSEYGPGFGTKPKGGPITTPWMVLTRPAIEGILYTSQPLRAVASIFLCGLWAAAVWAFFGAVICRTAAMQLTAEEKLGLGAAVRFAARKWPAHLAAPMMPIGGIILLAIPVIILGWIIRAGGFGVLLGGIFWPLALVAGFVMALLMLGVLFGWPLMWGAVSSEGSDSFDALSRAYAYLFQRPLHYLFYAAVAGVIGLLGWWLVSLFASGVVWMTYWAAGWGCGGALATAADAGGMSGFGAGLIGFFAGCVKLLAVGYLFSYFWAASTAIYLLLRRNVDATDLNEVYLDTEEETGDLPVIGEDSAGAPVAEGDEADSPKKPEEQN